jgi:anti-sigma regulatory factor (Ser/Thr protein kinase)
VAIELPLEPESAGRARDAIEPLRPQADGSAFDDVRLLVSELVCDALATERQQANGTVSVEARALDGATRVTVGLEGVALRLKAEKPQPEEPGWGVYLVQTLAMRWGARRVPGGTDIWFEA